MAKKVWSFLLEDGPHTVELEHGFISGRKDIRIDGQPLPLPAAAQSTVDFGGDYPFTIGRHEGFVHIRTNGLTFSYDLSLDGRSVDTGEAADRTQATRNRQLYRTVMTWYAIIAGVVMILFGDRWHWLGLPLNYVGVLILIVGILGLVGINVFAGGPLDKRDDP